MLSMLPFITAFLTTTSLAYADPVFPDCMPGNFCFQLKPYLDKEWIFDCAAINTTLDEVKGNVLFLHGNDGPRSKAMWSFMMQGFANKGYNTLAFDQRGFSPSASPYDPDEYNYDYLAEDIFAIADSYFGIGSKFHLVAHDQGARLGWHAIAVGTARKRYLSYTPLSEAHSDAFSDSLYGPNADSQQQTAFMYLWSFTLPGNSTLAYKNNIWNVVCAKYHHYDTPKACQPSIWWYVGAVNSGNLAMQPFGKWGSIGNLIGIPEDYITNHTMYPLDGQPQTKKVGNVTEFPVMYVCGAGDYADKCNTRFRDGTAKYVKDFHYYESTNCGHDLVSKNCKDYQIVIDNIVHFVENISHP
jgi:pimeloyl-ACP methyl ester carboxylesterase